MWQRFSESGRKVVYFAQEEAQAFGEGYVSTEHLLLGLLREPAFTAMRVLARIGIDPNRLRSEVEKDLPRREARPNQDMTLTPRAKRVIDLAFNAAKELRNNYIGTEHLLLGLIREGDGLAGRVLGKMGVRLEAAREAVVAEQAFPSPIVIVKKPAHKPGWTVVASEVADCVRNRSIEAELRTADRTLLEMLDAHSFTATRILEAASIDRDSLIAALVDFAEQHPHEDEGEDAIEWRRLEILCGAEKQITEFDQSGTQHLLLAVLDLGLGYGAEALAANHFTTAQARQLATTVELED